MKEKYKPKPYVYQEFPRMVYHPKCGCYVIIDSEVERPEGFVNNPADVENFPQGTEEPVPCKPSDYTVVSEEPEVIVPKKASSKKPSPQTNKVDDEIEDTAHPTLESLNVTRKEALKMLEEENIPFRGNASNEVIAGLVAELLKAGDVE